ncbi:branched-chain amino acid ABC transporter substrate-binding protein [Antribacter gilvus]|uniref:branched-chain amino acid ABC transporter substrate-binding protein n=1 Tax=Antribacter gilvus TaxID=2304675 RepID=UPI000F783123|nr:branched-chain amino acid ABC transporter substrate-binding protein [Antribacter gilvus]
MRRNTLFAAGALTLAVALTASACGTVETGGGGGGGTEGECAIKVGVMGALSGANAGIVIPSVNGAKLALKEYQETDPECAVELIEFDTEGDPAKATPVATQMSTDESFLGVIGGAFSGETRATKAIFDDSGLTMISQSATATDLTQEEPADVFHRVVGHDLVQGTAIANYVGETLGASKVFVVDDSTAYGEPLAGKIKEILGDKVAATDKTQEKQTDFSAVVGKIKGAQPDAVVYAGYAAEAGPFLKQLRDAGVTVPFVGGDGLYGVDFPKAAGEAAEGAIVTCPCVPVEGTFAEDYEAEFGEAAGAYAGEGYDAMNIFLEAFAAGNTTREDVEAFVDAYEGEGLTKTYKFDEVGDVDQANVTVWSYKVEGGVLVPDQEIKQ